MFLGALLISACGAVTPQVSTPSDRTSAPTLDLPVLFEPAQRGIDAIMSSLELRHHTPIALMKTIGVDLVGERSLIVLYSYDSFSAWHAYRALEEWERNDAVLSGDQEFDVWMSGLEARGLDGLAQMIAEELSIRCTEEEDAEMSCREEEIWARTLEHLDYDGCGNDRLALVRFSFEASDQEPRLTEPIASLVLPERRCDPTTTLVPLDIDHDQHLELLMDVFWYEASSSGPTGSTSMTEHFELLFFDADVAPQLSRRLFDREQSPQVSIPEARYWFEDVNGDDSPEIIIERFSVSQSCSLEQCSRLAQPVSRSTFVAPSCFPRFEATVCIVDDPERTVLTFDRQHNLWL